MADVIMDGIVALNKAKKYVAESLDGLGAVKGSPCIIKSATVTESGTEIVFEWTGNSGVKENKSIFIKNGTDSVITEKTTVASEDGALGIRIWNGKFQYKQSNGKWADISEVSSPEIPDEPITDSDIADEEDIDNLFP